MSKKVNRNVVYCNDIDNLISHVCQQRGFHPETRLFVKIGIDGGGSFLKVCLNIDRENDELTSLISQKKKWSYEKQSSCDKFKYSGVFKLIILAIVEDVEESYTNVKCLLDLFNWLIASWDWALLLQHFHVHGVNSLNHNLQNKIFY